MITQPGWLQDVPALAGEPLGPSSVAEEPSGQAAVMGATQMLLSRCLAAPQVLWHGAGPFPVALLPLGAGTTRSPRRWCHFSLFPLAAPHCSATIDYFWMS